MTTEYTSIRVPVRTILRLRDFSRDIERQNARIPDPGNNGKCVCPLWYAIETLLDRTQAHRKRAAASRSTKPQERRTRAGCMHHGIGRNLDVTA